MSRRSGLGRGLEALLPTVSEPGIGSAEDGPVLTELAVDHIRPNPAQPRVHFDEDALTELAGSIAHLGVLQPILVHRGEDGYQLIAGERRWRAAQRAGLETIPAIVRNAPDDVTRVEQALVENLHRQDLSSLEEAAAYQSLVDDFGLTHDEIAQRIGKNRSTISNTLRLLSLPGEVQRLLVDGELTAGHAKALLGHPDLNAQRDLAHRAVAEGWSVRTTEQAVQRVVRDSERVDDSPTTELTRPVEVEDGTAGHTTDRPAGLLEVEQLLEERLSTRVRAELGRRGRLIIEFADLADLSRIYQTMVGDQTPDSGDRPLI